MQAFETLSLLEGTSNCTALAIESGTRLRSEDKADLDYYFNKAGPQDLGRAPHSHSWRSTCSIHMALRAAVGGHLPAHSKLCSTRLRCPPGQEGHAELREPAVEARARLCPAGAHRPCAAGAGPARGGAAGEGGCPAQRLGCRWGPTGPACTAGTAWDLQQLETGACSGVYCLSSCSSSVSLAL